MISLLKLIKGSKIKSQGLLRPPRVRSFSFAVFYQDNFNFLTNKLEKIPKKLKKAQNLNLAEAATQVDQLYLDKGSIDDIALLFYIILTIERNFSKPLKDFRYKVSSESPEFPKSFKDDLEAVLNAIAPEQLGTLSCFDDILEITKYFEGNMTRLFSKFEFHKTLIYVRTFSCCFSKGFRITI